MVTDDSKAVIAKSTRQIDPAMPPRCILSKVVCLFQLFFFFFSYFQLCFWDCKMTSGSKQFDIVNSCVILNDVCWYLWSEISVSEILYVSQSTEMVFLSFELEPGETLLTKYIVPFEFKVFILNFRIEFLVEKMKISLSY